MKVNKKLAAKMVGIGRTTFYNHILEKSISVDPSGQIDVAELIRVYGNDKVKMPDQLNRAGGINKDGEKSSAEVQLAEELKRLKLELENQISERHRERDQLNSQIEHLKSSLDKSMEQNGSITRLLTDERAKSEAQKTAQEETLNAVLATVKNLENHQKKNWWSRRKRA